jgi:choline dehydrogenase-like flavoprotein
VPGWREHRRGRRLQELGVDALHVVDASVMPTVVRAQTNLTSIAVGERTAELLR